MGNTTRTNSTSSDSNGNEQIDWLTLWIDFVQSRWRKAVSRDLWDQTLIFAKRTLDDASLAWWSEEASWPGVVDEFVGSVKAEREKKLRAGGERGEGGDGGGEGEKMDTN